MSNERKATVELPATRGVGFSKLLGERLTRVIQLRENQDKTFKEIGQAIGCGPQRAAQLYHTAKRLQEYHAQGEGADPYYGLSVRIANCCINKNLMSREQIAAAIKDGSLHPRASAQCRNFGWKSYKEVQKWLGLPEPDESGLYKGNPLAEQSLALAPGSAYQRDFSLYARSHGGRACRYHFLGDDCASKCGRARVLDTEHPMDVEVIPTILRCRANGCRQLWPNVSS